MGFRYELVLPNEDLPFRLFVFEGSAGNYRVTKHWHQSLEIFLVIEGTINFYINNKPILLKAKDFVFVNSNEIHAIDAPEKNTTIVLQIPVKAFKGYLDEPSCISFGKKEKDKNDVLAERIVEMYDTYTSRAYGYRLKVESQFLNLLYMLLTQFKEEAADEQIIRQKRHLDRLSKVTQYMKENYNQALSLEAVADKFGFTPTYLSRIFKKYAQVNYRTYLIDLRVNYAVRDLMNTDNTISTIALDHGFADSRAFSKAFYKRYGCLPGAYRKKMLQS